jgi:hypothetical protein
MKDNAHVTIYGTDHATYGGGANVIDYESLKDLLPARLTQGMTMRITLRHAHRLSNNTIIDDVGVPTDILLAETMDEVINPTSSFMIAKIFSDLARSSLRLK